MNQYIDHTVLKPFAVFEDIEKCCLEAINYKFVAVCIHPIWVGVCKKILSESEVKTCTVVGFPLGINDTETKVFETSKALKNGADEIDMVVNISWIKDDRWDEVISEISILNQLCIVDNKILKVIFETCYLTNEEIMKLCRICVEHKVAFVKTSTGFGTGGATLEHIKLMKYIVGDNCKIKASGGVKDFKTAKTMIEAGATRIGTSSGVDIIVSYLKSIPNE
jgi:deoxyribose-phosphate aldolase